ncbi:MAG: diphthine--ammonia ligase [Gemmatimonadaceae bacterium]|nr:diphthine--ammonia ligase [Chitinophagaceae bacterium]
MQAMQQGYEPRVLINMMNENGRISRSHGLPYALLSHQASEINLPLVAHPASWENYESIFIGALKDMKTRYGISSMVFGDIDLQAHRDWEEKVCLAADMEAVLPIWKQDREILVGNMIDAGIETMIVSCNETLGENFLGRMLTRELLPELRALGVDVCGENGEFHTLVVNCPLFKNPISVPPFVKVKHDKYWFLQFEV